jgi:hypothetical protein
MGTPRESIRIARWVAGLAFSQGQNRRIRGFSLDAAVPAYVVVAAIAIALAVPFVVLAVVADEVVEREAVVAGDVVDAVAGKPAAAVEVGAPRDACRDISGGPGFAAHEAANRVTVATVPLGPGHSGETADLVQAPGIPGFGDHRRPGQGRRRLERPGQRWIGDHVA